MKAWRVVLLAIPLLLSGGCALTLEQAPVPGPSFFLDLKVEELSGADGQPVGIRVEGQSSKGPIVHECRGWNLKETEAGPREPRLVRPESIGEVRFEERIPGCALIVMINKVQKLYECESAR